MRIVKSAEVRKREVLACATRLFGTRGYEQTSINQIIAALGISKGAFYHHYSSKEDLVEALAEGFALEAAQRARTVLDDPTLDAFERLSLFLSRIRNQKLESATQLQATFAPLFQPENAQLYERIQAAVNAVIKPVMVAIIAEGIADRTFDTPSADEATDIILHLMGSTRQLIANLYAASGRDGVDAVMARIEQRFTYLGTVIDRILGIPEGSIELIDQHSLQVMSAAWRQAVDAA